MIDSSYRAIFVSLFSRTLRGTDGVHAVGWRYLGPERRASPGPWAGEIQ